MTRHLQLTKKQVIIMRGEILLFDLIIIAFGGAGLLLGRKAFNTTL